MKHFLRHFSYLIKTIESENRTIFARQSVNGRAISLKGDMVLPWDREVLGEWNHLFFFTYEIRNVSSIDRLSCKNRAIFAFYCFY
jgi:hypothetical protein